ncbi:type II secretion system protein E [Solidesulfovibrio carbinoliphilus subsp. oakridgensis]|uniref:Type II secretion system protein E n=1 Tax=Solidesulfovibrio carbinoliphilus subsp. oakridgensis TaxID=694327 RepID=G7QB75_9BACT|nr:ATPase, T2SS/T4P/T4SS family [Solidesulfovibrio carbinoliphilus]EHJ48817.1 type II secretion system protein E [Solidesulfovibrio carbinoliphilus subsp. oakridgensis]
MLVDLSFSDLIILPDGSARLKGCPETGQQLIPVPADCTDEIKDLPNRLTDAVLSRRHMDPATGMRVESGTIRFHHQGIHYRVADIQDVNSGRTWFLRRLAERVPDLTGLGLPPYLCEWLLLEDQRQGLVLVAGAQASGKTTTASALVAGRLMRHGGHGVTFENPAELPLGGSWGEHGHCFQTEIQGEHELPEQIKRAHRYASPNIIFIGEILTKYAALEALRVALGSKQQLVVATIHGLDVIAALERLINWAQEFDGNNACENLANSLLAIILQDLEGEPKWQKISQYLLLPFVAPNPESSMRVKGIRAKLRERQFHSLHDDMRELRNRIADHGLKAI